MAIPIPDYNRLATEWLTSHGVTGRPCSLCGTTVGWQLLPPAEIVLRTGDVEEQTSGRAVPVVPIMCRHCAHVVFLSAIALGVVSPIGAPEDTEAAK